MMLLLLLFRALWAVVLLFDSFLFKLVLTDIYIYIYINYLVPRIEYCLAVYQYTFLSEGGTQTAITGTINLQSVWGIFQVLLLKVSTVTAAVIRNQGSVKPKRLW